MLGVFPDEFCFCEVEGCFEVEMSYDNATITPEAFKDLLVNHAAARNKRFSVPSLIDQGLYSF